MLCIRASIRLEWTQLTAIEEAKFSRAVTDVYRVIDGSVRADPGVVDPNRDDYAAVMAVKSGMQVVKDLGVMLHRLRIIIARGRMLAMVLDRSRADLMTLLVAGRAYDRSWIRTVEADLLLGYQPITSVRVFAWWNRCGLV